MMHDFQEGNYTNDDAVSKAGLAGEKQVQPKREPGTTFCLLSQIEAFNFPADLSKHTSFGGFNLKISD